MLLVLRLSDIKVIMNSLARIRQCQRPRCGFRFPVSNELEDMETCPKCGGPVKLIEIQSPDLGAPTPLTAPAGPEVEVLLDSIRSTFNVGSMFRTADGAGVRRIHLCGITPTPDHPKIAKTALGAELSVPWTQHWDALSAVREIKSQGLRVWGLEGGTDSHSIFDSVPDLPGSPILLVVGNEVSGIDRDVLACCDRIISIPMQGVKRSLNVAIAFGISVYFLRYLGGTSSAFMQE